jgi:hypothetical protein
VSSCRLTLTWTDNNSNAYGFKIERAPSGTGPWNQIAQLLPNAPNYRDTGLLPGTTYYYRMRAYNSAGDSDYSNVASNTTLLLGSTSIVAWGLNNNSQATPPSGATGLLAVESGTSHSLALQSDGTVVGWGLNTSEQATPPAGLSGVIAIAAGWSHSLALQSDGTVVGWGLNTSGQATPPAGLSGVVDIAAGGSHSLALQSDGTVVGWGLNTSEQATPPAGLSGVVAVAAGGSHSLALKSDGTVVGWGSDTSGQATPPAGLVGVVDISAGGSHSLALKSDGSVIAWGSDVSGQATLPANLTGAVAISAGGGHSAALVTGCFYALSAGSINTCASESSGNVGVIAPSACGWTASTDSDWLHTSSGGTGNGIINYTVDANATNARSGTITMQGQTFTVNQGDSGNLGITVTAAPATGGVVNGAGVVTCGSSVTVSAMANASYHFVNWTEAGTVVSTSPIYTFTVSASRALMANFQSLPVIVNPPSISNGVAELDGMPIVMPGGNSIFTALTTDATGNPLTCLWNFGDDTTSTDCQPTHVFDSCGQQTVSYVATESNGAAVSTSLAVLVACPFETLPAALSVNLKVNFKPGRADMAKVRGFLKLPVGYSVANLPAQLSVGHVDVPFTLDGKGTSRTGASSLKLRHDGKANSPLWQLTAKLKGDWSTLWAEDGLTNATTSLPLTLPVLLLLDSNPPEVFAANQPLNYKAKEDQSGTAK